MQMFQAEDYFQEDNPEWDNRTRYRQFALQFEDPLQFPYGPDIVWSGLFCPFYRGCIWRFVEGQGEESWFWGKVTFQHTDTQKHQKQKIRFYFQQRLGETSVRIWEHAHGELSRSSVHPVESVNSPAFFHQEYCVKCSSPENPPHRDTEDSSEESSSDSEQYWWEEVQAQGLKPWDIEDQILVREAYSDK